MPQFSVFSFLAGSANAAAGGNAAAVAGVLSGKQAGQILPQQEGFAPFLTQQVGALLKAAEQKGGAQGNATPSTPSLVASLLQNLSVVVAGEGEGASQQEGGQSFSGQQQSPLLGRIMQLIQQQGQAAVAGGEKIASLVTELSAEQIQELATLLQVTEAEIRASLEMLVEQSEEVLNQFPVTEHQESSILQDEEEEDKIFDSATLFAPQAAQQLPEKNLQTDQPVQGVLYNAEANPEAVAKIKSLLGDVLNLEVSPLQEVVVEMPAVIPSVGSVSEAIAQAATQPELPVGSPSSFTLTPPANENAVVEDIEIISRRAGQPHPLMTMAHEASNEEGLVIPSSPIKSQNTEKQPDSLPPVVNHSENQPFKTTLRQGRDAVKAVEEEVITSRFSVRSNDTSAESLADFASGAETQFSVREEGVIEAEDSITAIRENTVSQISARATKKITQAAERFALRQDNTVPAEQVLVRIRDLPRPGNHRIQIHLDPVELGKVDVTMDVAIDGRTQLTMTVDRKETLELLQRDRVSLEKSLNELGLKTDAGGMSFNLREQPKGQQQAAGDNQSQQNPQQPFRNQDVLPEELREDLTPLEPYRSYLLTLDESVNISV